MATTRRVTVTATPTDVVAGQSLGIGTYTIQNLGQASVLIVARDAAVADPATLDGQGAELLPKGSPLSVGAISVAASTDTVYLYARHSGPVAPTLRGSGNVATASVPAAESVVAITEAP